MDMGVLDDRLGAGRQSDRQTDRMEIVVFIGKFSISAEYFLMCICRTEKCPCSFPFTSPLPTLQLLYCILSNAITTPLFLNFGLFNLVSFSQMHFATFYCNYFYRNLFAFNALNYIKNKTTMIIVIITENESRMRKKG